MKKILLSLVLALGFSNNLAAQSGWNYSKPTATSVSTPASLPKISSNAHSRNFVLNVVTNYKAKKNSTNNWIQVIASCWTKNGERAFSGMLPVPVSNGSKTFAIELSNCDMSKYIQGLFSIPVYAFIYRDGIAKALGAGSYLTYNPKEYTGTVYLNMTEYS